MIIVERDDMDYIRPTNPKAWFFYVINLLFVPSVIVWFVMFPNISAIRTEFGAISVDQASWVMFKWGSLTFMMSLVSTVLASKPFLFNYFTKFYFEELDEIVEAATGDTTTPLEEIDNYFQFYEVINFRKSGCNSGYGKFTDEEYDKMYEEDPFFYDKFEGDTEIYDAQHFRQKELFDIIKSDSDMFTDSEKEEIYKYIINRLEIGPSFIGFDGAYCIRESGGKLIPRKREEILNQMRYYRNSTRGHLDEVFDVVDEKPEEFCFLSNEFNK